MKGFRIGVGFILLSGCQAEQTTTWMTGAGYEWNALNHRMSFLHFGVQGSTVTMGVIGGTSTTGMVTTLPDDCSFSDCQELPVKDTSSAWVNWQRVTTRKAVFQSGQVTFDVSLESTVEEVSFELDASGYDNANVLITGMTWDTNAPLISGAACYDPFNGWHPRQMAIDVTDAVIQDDGKATATVTGIFEAGDSLETIRECIDAVNEEAQVHLTVQLLAVATKAEAQVVTMSQGESYSYGSKAAPDPQEAPDWATRQLELATEEHMVGWSAVDFMFHKDDPDNRGAYLRSFEFDLDIESNIGYGHATNYSPGSQLSGFEYNFTGTAVSIPVPGEYERGRVELQLEAVVDEDKVPVLVTTEI